MQSNGGERGKREGGEVKGVAEAASLAECRQDGGGLQFPLRGSRIGVFPPRGLGRQHYEPILCGAVTKFCLDF